MAAFNVFSWYNNLSLREKRFFSIGSACVLLLILDMAVVRPVWDSYVVTKEQIAVAEASLTRNLINLQRKEAVETTYDKYQSYVQPAGKDEEENASLLSEIERLARSNQVVLVDMKPREAKTGQYYKQFVAELDAEAEMKNLISFIYQLEEATKLIKVSNAKLSPKEEGSSFVKAKIIVTKTAFLEAGNAQAL